MGTFQDVLLPHFLWGGSGLLLEDVVWEPGLSTEVPAVLEPSRLLS